MKYRFLAFAILAAGVVFTNVTEAAVRVHGYYKPSTGSYVMPHYKTSPNSSRFDNYSTKGNYNPFTGKKGSVNPYKW